MADGTKPWTDKREDTEVLADAIQSCVQRVNEAFARLHRVEQQLNLQARVDTPSQIVKRFDSVLADNLPSLLENTQKLNDPLVSQQIDLIFNALFASRELIYLTQVKQKPSDPATLNSLFFPVTRCVADVTTIATKNTTAKSAALLSALSTGAQGLHWLFSNNPGAHVAAQRAILTKIKLTSPYDIVHVSFQTLLDHLQNGLDSHLKQGLVWKGTKEGLILCSNSRGQMPMNHFIIKPPKAHVVYDGTATNDSTTIQADGQPVVIFGQGGGPTLQVTGKAIHLSLENCSFTTVEVKGQVNTLIVENCTNSSVTIPDGVGSIQVNGSTGCVFIGNLTKAEVTTINSSGLSFGESANNTTVAPTFKFKVKGGKIAQIKA